MIFKTKSDICKINDYSLHSERNDEHTHEAFSSEGQLFDSGIRFDLNEETLDTFYFYLKVTADGGEEWWSSQL